MSRCLKTLSIILASLSFGGMALAASDQPAPAIGFGIDCMIHDPHGALLKDFGMIGMMPDGAYMPAADFAYGDLHVEASLQGPSPATPEVTSPAQLELRIVKPDGTVTASVTVGANPQLNIALWEPTENVYLHCDTMNMGM